MKASVNYNIVLIGMMGTGKSSVAAALSRMTGLPSFDTDAVFRSRYGSISAWFADKGETAFREKETEIVREASAVCPAIISTGGGVVLRGENMCELRRLGKVALLTASPETIYARTCKNNERPLLKNNSMSDIIRIFEERKALYLMYADITVDTDNDPPERCAEKILELLKSDRTFR